MLFYCVEGLVGNNVFHFTGVLGRLLLAHSEPGEHFRQHGVAFVYLCCHLFAPPRMRVKKPFLSMRT